MQRRALYRLTPALDRYRLGRQTAVVIIFMIAIYSFFIPKWETNDDVMMAMIAHGYGFIIDQDPRLLFSSVVWGHIAQSIPPFFGVQGYSWLTILSLSAAALVFLVVLEKRTNSVAIPALFVAAIFFRPLLLPQFTVVSGLLTGAGVIALLNARHDGFKWSWIGLFIILSTVGFWIRWRECILILVVFSPLFFSRSYVRNRRFIIALVVLLLSLVLSAYVDNAAYDNPQWRDFQEANEARVPYTDNRLAVRLQDREDLLEKFGYSLNDIKLISWFFFVDQDQMRPERLNDLGSAVPVISDVDFKFRDGVEGLKALSDPAIVVMVFVSAALLILRRSTPLFVCAILFLLAVFALGFAGRPGAIRVYYPVIAVLCASTFVVTADRSMWSASRCRIQCKRGMVVVLGVLAVILNAATLYPVVVENNRLDVQAQHDMSLLDDEMVYVWGAALPFDRFFPVWTPPENPSNLYALGVSSFAPYAVPFKARGTDADLYVRLRNGVETPFVGYEELWDHIDIFCNERFGTSLQRVRYKTGMLVNIDRIRCQ